jgi:hypothetical protein
MIDKDKAIAQLNSRFQELKRLRYPYEPQWRDIADFLGVTRGSELTTEKQSLRRRKIFDAHGRTAKARLTAQLHGGMVNPLSPWAIASPTREEPDEEAAQWFDKATRRLHQYLTSTSSLFSVALAEYLDDVITFGNGYIWLGDDPTKGPVFRAVSVWNCWIDVDEHGRVDTLYRSYKMKASRAAKKWPDATKLAEAAKHDGDRQVTIIHAVEPRIDFSAELDVDAPLNKPWRDVQFYQEGPELLEESGRDRFPYAVGRFYKRPDETYGYGPSDEALPDIRLANAISETVLRMADLAADPPLMMPVGFMVRRIDRRAGAINYYDASKALLSRGDPVANLQKTGDVQLGVAMLEMIHDKIEAAYFSDWMTLPNNVAETATAVNDRKDLRAAGMAHMIVRQEVEALDPIAEHGFEVLEKLDWFDQPPESLLGADLRFVYRTPLHLALQRGEVDAVVRFIGVIQQMESLSPGTANQVLNVEETSRFMAARVGLPLMLLNQREVVAAKKQAQEEAEASAASVAQIQQGAQAAQAGSQAMANLGMTPEDLGAFQ